MFLETHTFFANLSWILLIIILVSRPLAEITKNKILFRVLRYRKQLGVICGLAAIVHVLFFLLGSGLAGIYFLDAEFWSLQNFYGWGSLAVVAMLFPLLTSNNFSLHFFGKYWKKIQRGTYLVFIATAIHIAMVKDEWFEVMGPVLIWLFLWTWAELRRRKRFKV
ncbi:ferric reductase-like transmembrane domain-containing protein [Candidatus Parcubacteria bacterium]|nr:ferric reductase-like transmembrane domain-containing protein [Patescibacteria group bacterium]MBU4309945.1 ferric reductase-like transmembrane domain-containing protein [Patescibacteria group bacterium]MBU4432255.1 ferric reductase-like transmembrane domain-containing protein [Patescibacteria group bacterium]MBU4577870.1 ferric reductase-like transmembrane domain-containing protein [Patescibacteria group bacterium]MCG2696931.1 ferric reductase-like transmembrane domain-containing protein [C